MWKWTCRQVLTIIWWKKSWKNLVWHLAFRSKLKWHKRLSEILKNKPTGFQHETVPSHYFNSLTLTGNFFFALFCFPATLPLSCCVYGTEDKNKESTFHLKNKCRGGGWSRTAATLEGTFLRPVHKRSRFRPHIWARDLEVTGEAAAGDAVGHRFSSDTSCSFWTPSEILGVIWGSVAASGAPFSRGLITSGSLQATPSITYLLLFSFETEK